MEIISTGRRMGKTGTLIYMSDVTNIPNPQEITKL